MIRATVAMVCALAALAHADAAVPGKSDGDYRCEGYASWVVRTSHLVGINSAEWTQGPYKIEESAARKGLHRMLVTDAKTGAKRYELVSPPAKLVLGEHDRIAGALVLDHKGKHDFYDENAKWKWSIPSTGQIDAAAVADGRSLFVALYRRDSTGARLYRYNRASGALEWEAPVEQLNADHSVYWNDVRLELSDGKIVMRGEEAAGCYLQIFEAATGKRLSSRFGKPATR